MLHVRICPIVKVADCVFHFSFGRLSTPRFIIILRIQNWTGWVSGSHIAIGSLDNNKIKSEIFISSYLKSRHSHSMVGEFSVITSTCCRINCIYQEYKLCALLVSSKFQIYNLITALAISWAPGFVSIIRSVLPREDPPDPGLTISDHRAMWPGTIIVMCQIPGHQPRRDS